MTGCIFFPDRSGVRDSTLPLGFYQAVFYWFGNGDEEKHNEGEANGSKTDELEILGPVEDKEVVVSWR